MVIPAILAFAATYGREVFVARAKLFRHPRPRWTDALVPYIGWWRFGLFASSRASGRRDSRGEPSSLLPLLLHIGGIAYTQPLMA